MARSTYQAPGVYVEEVPSAQQPIAGVGTNTVGFIGIVQDEIQYPVSNPDYDPVLAKLAVDVAERMAAGADVAESIESFDERINKKQADVQELEAENAKTSEELKKAQGELAELDRELQELQKVAEENLSDEQKKRRTQIETKDKPARLRSMQKLADTVKQRDDQINKLKDEVAEALKAKEGKKSTLEAGKASVLRPYTLETFKIVPDIGDTKLCTNFSEYRSLFGPFSAGEEDDPGKAKDPGHRALTHAVYGFFQNGGTRCFVARVKNRSEITAALEKFESIDAVAIMAAPGLDGADVWGALMSHCETCEDRFAILDCPEQVEDGDGNLDLTLLDYGSQNPDRDNYLPQRNKNAAFYFPYIEVIDPAKQLQDQDPSLKKPVPSRYQGRLFVAPSGHIAGVYARTDETRGVHKAPANAAVLGAINVKYYIGKPKHELLNPQGVNVIRNINGNVTVWGARTVGGDSNTEWKYVNVRRLFLFLRESIDEGTQWVVFEPNDRALWGKIRRNVSDFLRNVWRSGALFGSTPEEAFYVKCDDETNPPEVRELGQVITEIGVAIVRPAEFVIFRVTQSTGARK